MFDGRTVTHANKAHYDRIANEYDDIKDATTRALFGKKAQKRIDGVICLLASETNHEKLLDLGCGTGNVLKFSKERFNCSVGMDISIPMLFLARKHSKSLVNGDGCFLPFKNSSFDAVTCISVLHHIYDLKALMAEIHRVLREGGIFHSDHDPNKKYFDVTNGSFLFSSIRGIIYKVSRITGKQKPLNVNGIDSDMVEYHWSKKGGIDSESLKQMMEAIGFGDIQIVFHSDSDSIKHPTKGPFIEKAKELLVRILCLERKYENVCRIISVIAKKQPGYEG